MKAIKENKIYTVDEVSKASYLAQGYDIYDDKGKLIERSPSGTVSRAEYDKLSAENKKLSVENARLKKAAKNVS